MAKRSGSTFDNKPEVEFHEIIGSDPIKDETVFDAEELGIDPLPKITYNTVTNLLPSRVIREVNGVRYEWKPGEQLLLPHKDAEPLRSLILGGRPCCGNLPHPIFEVSED
mgnify:CR=1 FL=1